MTGTSRRYLARMKELGWTVRTGVRSEYLPRIPFAVEREPQE